MVVVIYYGPVGNPIENPSEKFIRDIVFHKNESYWRQGSGDSSIEINGIEERLILFCDEPYGFLKR